MSLGIGIGIGIGLGGGNSVDFPTITGYAFGHNFNAMQGTQSGGAAALAVDPNLQTIATTNYLADIAAGSNGWYVDGNRVWFSGSGVYRGMTMRGVAGVSPYPAGSNSTFISLPSLYKAAGTSIDPQNFTAFYILQNSIRSNDAYEVDGGGAAFLLDRADKMQIFLDSDNRIGVTKMHTVTVISQANPTSITSAGHGLSTGDRVLISYANSTPAPAGWYTVTVTGTDTFTIPFNVATTAGTSAIFYTDKALSNLYAHAGTNAICVRVASGTVKIDTYHGGSYSTSYTPASGASAVMNFLGSQYGPYKFLGSVQEDRFFTTGAVSDADVALLMDYARRKYNLVPHQNMVAFLGDSYMAGYWDVPARSIPNRIAQAHPTWFVLNASKPGATLQAGGNSLDTQQVPRVRRAITYCKPAGGTAVAFMLGGSNDSSSRTSNQMSSDASTISTDLRAVASGVYTPPSKVLIATPLSRPQVGTGSPIADAVLENMETQLADLATDLNTKVPSEFDGIVDLKALYSTPVSNTGTNLKNMVLNDDHWTLSDSTTNLIAADSATSADGIHRGLKGQSEMASSIDTLIDAHV